MFKWTGLLLFSCSSILWCCSAGGQEHVKSQPVQALMTDSVVVNVEHPPEKVWAHIKKLYVDGDRYRQRGLEVSKISDDPQAWQGGLHAVSKADAAGPAVDLKMRFSIIDDENRFLAMHMDGMLPQGIYVSHDVSPTETGSRYQVIIHAFMEVPKEGDQPQTAEEIRKWMTARYAGHNEGLKATVQQSVVDALDD